MRPTRPVGTRPQCCGSNQCNLCPIDSKGTALNTVYPSIHDRVELRSGLLATTVHCKAGRVDAVTAIDATGQSHRLHAKQFVVACNGVDSCLLLQRSPDVPKLPSLGRHFMDHPIFQIGIYGLRRRRAARLWRQRTDRHAGTVLREDRDRPAGLDAGRNPHRLALAGTRRADARHHDARHDQPRPGRRPRIRRPSARAFATSGARRWISGFSSSRSRTREHTLSIERIEPNGQAVPRIALALPTLFRRVCRPRHDMGSGPSAPRHREAPRQHSNVVPLARRDASGRSRRRDGCVDPTLRYHELENLYILSTSVFPSASSANPTLTLGALALRLGDHLGRRG